MLSLINESRVSALFGLVHDLFLNQLPEQSQCHLVIQKPEKSNSQLEQLARRHNITYRILASPSRSARVQKSMMVQRNVMLPFPRKLLETYKIIIGLKARSWLLVKQAHKNGRTQR